MDIGSWLLRGFASTVVLTGIMSAAYGLGLTRMSIPFLVGTMFTPSRERAKVYGIALHMLNGWIFSLVHVNLLHAWGGPTWWKGAIAGLAHGLFGLMALMPVLPGLHPRMASAAHGPEAARRLEPPGFLGLHYGYQTPLVSGLAHVGFGIVLGAFYGR